MVVPQQRPTGNATEVDDWSLDGPKTDPNDVVGLPPSLFKVWKQTNRGMAEEVDLENVKQMGWRRGDERCLQAASYSITDGVKCIQAHSMGG